MGTLGWLIILITISPLQSCPKYLKTISILRPSIDNCPTKLSGKERIKQRFNGHQIERMIVKLGNQKHKVQKAELHTLLSAI